MKVFLAFFLLISGLNTFGQEIIPMVELEKPTTSPRNISNRSWMQACPAFNDQYFPRQYYLGRINVCSVWSKYPDLLEKRRNDFQATVVVMDGGVTPHADLFHLDQTAGVSFVTSLPRGELIDTIPHGTHLAGIIAAEPNDGLGVVGIGGNALQIVSLKMAEGEWDGFDPLGSAGRISESAIYKGLLWLQGQIGDEDLWAINASWESWRFSEEIEQEFNNTDRAIFCAATGNKGLRGEVAYPARQTLTMDNILSVAALSEYSYPTTMPDGSVVELDTLVGFSNFEPNEVDVLAPGDHIFSLWPHNGTTYMKGTSQAAPQCAATAGLIIQRAKAMNLDISRLTPEMIKESIKNGARQATLRVELSGSTYDKPKYRLHENMPMLDVAGAIDFFISHFAPELQTEARTAPNPQTGSEVTTIHPDRTSDSTTLMNSRARRRN